MAITVTVIAGLLAFLLATKKKMTLAIIVSAVAAIALFIAFPELLLLSFGIPATAKMIGTLLVGAVGIIFILVATRSAKSQWLVLVGMVVMMLAVFRLIPTGPIAFEHLAASLGEAGKIIVPALVRFVKELVSM